jgi:hypothetical protein
LALESEEEDKEINKEDFSEPIAFQSLRPGLLLFA